MGRITGEARARKQRDKRDSAAPDESSMTAADFGRESAVHRPGGLAEDLAKSKERSVSTPPKAAESPPSLSEQLAQAAKASRKNGGRGPEQSYADVRRLVEGLSRVGDDVASRQRFGTLIDTELLTKKLLSAEREDPVVKRAMAGLERTGPVLILATPMGWNPEMGTNRGGIGALVLSESGFRVVIDSGGFFTSLWAQARGVLQDGLFPRKVGIGDLSEELGRDAPLRRVTPERLRHFDITFEEILDRLRAHGLSS